MKLSTLIAAFLPVLLLACAAPDEPTAVTAPVDETIRFVPIDDSSVAVHWTGEGLENATITWESQRGEQIGIREASASPAVITIPDPGESYLVVVRPRVGGGIGRFIRAILAPRPSSNEPAVSGLKIVSLSASSVRVSWSPVPQSGATYFVGWRKVGAGDSMTRSTGSTSQEITNLEPGVYTFSVYATYGGTKWAPTSMQWAPATRYTHEPANPGLTLRMHEVDSEYGPALILDPSKGGPRNVGVRTQDPLSAVALAIYTDQSFSEFFDIGPGYAFTGFRNSDKFDSSTYISREGFSVSSLDDFYLAKPLDFYINSGGVEAGNISAFRLPISDPSGKGFGFVVRHGNGSQQHYARVFVKNVGGKLLQGIQPNRYVELEISYQTVANVPYAKRAPIDVTIPATRRR